MSEISDEIVEEFLRGAGRRAFADAADVDVLVAAWVDRVRACPQSWEDNRAGLAAALVASGYRREADVLREAAADIRNTGSFPWGPGGDPEDWCDAIAAHLERRAQTLDPAQPLPVAGECVSGRRADGAPLPPMCCGGWADRNGGAATLCDPCPPEGQERSEEPA